MKTQMKLTVVALVFGLVLFSGGTAFAAISPGCQDLGGDPASPPGECQINSTVTAGGSFTVPETLHITGTGVIDLTSALTVNIGGGLVMDAGSLIDGNNPGSCPRTGFAITLNVTGDVTQVPGSIIRSNSCSGGAILITSKGTVDIDGLVESVGSISGTGANQAPGGGTIEIDASCNLTITDAGIVSSRGRDPGADKVHLQGGCKVKIFGLVESTGVGHGTPNTPKNHCDSTNRPDKPANSTACVEVWAGDSLVLDSTGTHNGEVNADTGGTGGSGGTSWIDLFARGDITLIGDTSGTLFDVHANGNAGTNDNGGVITVKSRDGSVRASGTVLQADALGGGGRGGSIDIEAASGINLNDAQIFARGDFNAIGGYGFGGQITVQSFSGSLSWQDTATAPIATGNVLPTGTGVPALRRGVITFINCTGGTVTTTGTLFPFIGAATTPTTVISVGPCSGSPSFQTYVAFPDCLCGGCFCLSSFSVSDSVLTINGEGLTGVNRVVFDASCNPGGLLYVSKPFLSQADTRIDLILPGGVLTGMHVILVNTAAGSSSCSTDTLP